MPSQAHVELGYQFKGTSLRVLGCGFADDIGLVTSRAAYLQQLLDGTDRWLAWAGMKAKPVKCRAFGYCRKRDNNGLQRFSAVDPCVSISGVAIPPITEA